MITNETALKLKEAGFPQKEENCFFYGKHFYQDDFDKPEGEGDIEVFYSEECDHDEYGGRHEIICYSPTLSELIEACGEKFTGLERNKFSGKYLANYQKPWSIKKKPWWTILLPSKYKIALTSAFSQTYENTLEIGSSPEEAVADLWIALNKK